MNRTSVSLIALLSLTIFSQSAQAGVANMINNYFTFRKDQKSLIVPERTLPPKHVVSPNYNERNAANWSNYYTRPDLQPVENLDNSTMVMRVDPEYRNKQQALYQQQYGQNRQAQYNQYEQENIDPAIGYAGIQRRAQMNSLEKYEGNVYIGDPGRNPFNLDNQGKAGQKTKIGQPKRSLESAVSSKVNPRIGDYDYVKSYKAKQSNNAFGDYSTTMADEQPREVTRSSGYFTKGEVPLPTQNNGYYKQNLPNNYTVQPRDTLSGISGQKQIYNDWKMWPLIYDKNRNQIKDPDLIQPGQKFGIPRAATASQNSQAKQRAMQKTAPYSFYDGR